MGLDSATLILDTAPMTMSLFLIFGLFYLEKIDLKRVVTGMITALANQGVAHTLKISLSGSKAFVTAYAAAALEVAGQRYQCIRKTISHVFGK